MIEKLKTLLWFAARPPFWAHAAALMARKFRPNRDTPALRKAAGEWARGEARPVAEVLSALGLLGHGEAVPALAVEELDRGRRRAEESGVAMGGAGDLELIYAVTTLLAAQRVLETGVAYGWSSLAILAAQRVAGLQNAQLASVDMPYAKRNNEPFVGIVVPESDRAGWTLIREPDRNGIRKALKVLGGPLDLCHYDSDKSWYGRAYAFPLLWGALRPGGVFISDDIQDNLYFRTFAEQTGQPFYVTQSQGKFVGILRKPA